MREYLVVFLVAAAVTYLLTVIAREIALRTGAVARVRDRDVHDEPIPYLGGLAMLGGLVAAYLVARELPFLSTGSGPFVFHDAGVVIAAGALICAVGVLDDLFELDALTKLGGQLLAAGFLVAFGVQFYFFSLPGGEVFALDAAQRALLTGFLVVATINAVNFVDGLDGLAAGVVGIGACAFFLFCYQLTSLNDASRATTAALLTVALAGACAGFLPHNVNPARLFMGDSGSMLIGLVLSAGAVTLTGQFNEVDLTRGGGAGGDASLVLLLPVLLPVAILVVPLLDLVLAVVRRTLGDEDVTGMQDGVRDDRAGFLDGFATDFFSADGELEVSEEQRQQALALAAQGRDEAVVACIDSFARTDFRGDLERITVPTLVVHGDADAVVPFEVSGKRSAEALQDVELVVVEGGPHGFNVSHAEELNRALVDFLAR